MSQIRSVVHLKAAVALAATITLTGAAHARDGAHRNTEFKAFRESHPELRGGEAKRLMMGTANPATSAAPTMTQAQWLDKHWQAPATQNLRTIQTFGDVSNNVRSGVDLDLGSTNTNITLGSRLFKHAGSVTITIGGAEKTFSAGQQVTAAEYVAVKQQLLGGQQTITLDSQGRATGGSLELDSITGKNDPMKANSLVVSSGLSVTGDFARNSDFRLNGDLINNGSVYTTSNRNSLRAGSISADDIVNNSGALIATQSNAPIDLTLNARGNLVNSGDIQSSGSLTLTAGNSLSNDGGRIVAGGDANLFTENVSNVGGSVTSNSGNINIAAPVGGNLSITNGGGTFNALNGSINIGNAENGLEKVATTVSGGDFYSMQTNLFSGDGALNFKVGEVTGTINALAGTAHITAATDDLKLGDIIVSGDPTIINTAGDVSLSGTVGVGGQPLAILASGDILGATGTTISTFAVNNAGNLLMVAGATLNDNGTTIDISAGNGGDIDLTANSTINTGGLLGNSGSITMVAFGGPGGAGNITFGDASCDSLVSTGVDVNILAQGNIAGNNITAGTSSLSAPTGTVKIISAVPFITGGTVVVDKASGAVTSGSFDVLALSNGQITLNQVNTNGSDLLISTAMSTAGQGITVQRIGTCNNNSQGGDVTIQSGALINIQNGITTSSFGNSGGAVSVTSFSSLPSDFHIESISTSTSTAGKSGGSVIINAPIDSFGASGIGLGFVGTGGGAGGTGGNITINSSYSGSATITNLFAATDGFGNSGNLFFSHAGSLIYNTSGAIQVAAPDGFTNGSINITATDIQALTNFILISSPLSNQGTGDITFNVPNVTASSGNIQLLAGRDISVQNMTSLSFINLNAGRNVSSGSLTAMGNGGNNAIGIFAHGTVVTSDLTSTSIIPGTDGGQIAIQTTGSSVSTGSLTADGNGAGGGQVFVQSGGSASFNLLSANGNTTGSGGSITVQATSNLSISTGIARANAGAGSGGSVSLEYNSSNLFDVSGLSANAATAGFNGGSIHVKNTGTGTILLSSAPTVANTGGVGGTIDLETQGAMAFGPGVSSMNTDGGTGGGTIRFKADTFSITSGSGLALTSNTTSGTPGSVNLQATNAASSINLASASNAFNLSSHAGFASVTAGSVTVNQFLNMRKLGLAANNGSVSLNQPISLFVPDFQTGGLNVLAAGDINLDKNIDSSAGILLVAGGNIQTTPTANVQIATPGNNFGGAISMVAGADFTDNGTTVTILGPSSAGGNIDFNSVGSFSSISSGGAVGGRNITMVAYEGSGGGRVLLPFASNIDSAPLAMGTTGNVSIIAGASSSLSLLTGTIIPQVLGFGGAISLATVTPLSNIAINKANPDVPLGAFQGPITQNASLVTSSLQTNGQPITVIGGTTITVFGSINSSRSFSGQGGNISLSSNGSINVTGAISANGVSNTSGTISLTGGPGNIQLSGDISAKSNNLIGTGGQVIINTPGELVLGTNRVIDTTGFGAGNFGGQISISADALLSTNSFTLKAPGASGAADGTISISTANTGTNGDIIISVGDGYGYVVPDVGPTGQLSLKPGHDLSIRTAVTVGELDVTLLANNVASQTAFSSIHANTLDLHLDNGTVTFLDNTNLIVSVSADASAAATASIRTLGNSGIGSVTGNNLDLSLDDIDPVGNVNLTNAMTLHQLNVTTAGGTITVFGGANVDAGVNLVGGLITVDANVGNSARPSTLTASNVFIEGTGTITGSTVSLTAKTDSGSLGSRLKVNTGFLDLHSAFGGSFFINNLFASEYELDNSSVGTGTLNVTGSSSIKISVGKTITANNIGLTSSSGGFTFLGTINAPVSASLTSFASITNGALGTLNTNALTVTSLNGNIGTNSGSPFNTNLTSISASALNGSVFLNLTGGATTIGDSTALNRFEVFSASTINTSGTITANEVVASANTGSIGTSTGSRFHIDADKLTANALGGNVNINNTGTGSLQLDSLTADPTLGTIDILSSGSLVAGTGSIAAKNIVLLAQNGNIGADAANRLNANSSNVSLNAPNGSVFYQELNATVVTINAASAASTTTGVFDFATSGTLFSTATGTIGGYEVVISVPGGNFSLSAPITATTKTTISIRDNLANSNFSGINSPELNLVSQQGDIGSGATRFQTNATTVSANSVLGDVFLDLTANNVVLGTTHGDTVDILGKSFSGGTISASTATLAATGNIGIDVNNRLLINATSFSATTSTGSVFLENLKTGTTTLTGNVTTTGTFFVVAAGTLQANGDIDAANISLAAPNGSLDLGGDLLATTSISLTASSDLTNATFVGAISAPSLSLTSTAGSVGTSTASRFSTSASTVSASGAAGVFLDLTNATGVTMGTSSAGTVFDVTTTDDIKGGTITAPIVKVVSGGDVGVSTLQRLTIDSASFNVTTSSGNVFLSNTRTGSSTITGTNSGTTTYDVVASDSLVIAGNITAATTVSVKSGNLLSATSGALTANNVFLSSNGDLSAATFTATVASSQLLGLESVTGNIGSLANRWTTTAPTVEATSGAGTFLNIPLTATGVTLQDSSAGTTLNVSTSNVGILNLNGGIDTGNGDMSFTVNGLGSSLNVMPAASLTTTEGDVALVVTDQSKVKTVPVKIFIGNGATIKGSGTTAGVGEVFIGTGTLPFATSPKNKKPPKGVTVTNVTPGQVFLGKKGIGIVKKATGISLNALGRNMVFNIGDKEKKNVVTLDSNVTITADPPGDVAPLSAARVAHDVQLLPVQSVNNVHIQGASVTPLPQRSDNWTLLGSLSGTANSNIATANVNAALNNQRLKLKVVGTADSAAVDGGSNAVEFVWAAPRSAPVKPQVTAFAQR